MIGAITEDAFHAISGIREETEYMAIALGSEPIAWLGSAANTIAGVVRRDRDGKEVSYSWGAYRLMECIGYGCDIATEHEAQMACLRCMSTRSKMAEVQS